MAKQNDDVSTKAPVKAQEEVKKATVSEPTYTVEEFMAAPKIFGTTSPDIVKAALLQAGKDSIGKCYTVSEAEEIVKKFKNKEVK